MSVGNKGIVKISALQELREHLSRCNESCVLGCSPGSVLSMYMAEILLPTVCQAVKGPVGFFKVNIDSCGKDLLQFLGIGRCVVPIFCYYKNTEHPEAPSQDAKSGLLSALRDINFEDGSAIDIHRVQEATQSQVATDKEDLESLVKREPVMLFIKGTRQQPFCKFTKATLALFRDLHITRFGTFDILNNEQVRQQLKEFSNWPTYPQLYSKGEFIGGVDIMQEMAADGSLKTTLPPECFADFGNNSKQVRERQYFLL
eukprot:GHVQ01024648.1.p1 GENE.GHVQ01024648.1~~GHVQ01024648.1.p1  ORF type:complete len:258 (+),score=35.65 GHVQ01024648.1:122-895(+)